MTLLNSFIFMIYGEYACLEAFRVFLKMLFISSYFRITDPSIFYGNYESESLPYAIDT